MKGSDREGSYYVSFAKGGSLSSVSFEVGDPGDPVIPRANRGGGKRGPVKGLSRQSRRNLLKFMARIDRVTFKASGRRIFFVTVTYPGTYPVDLDTCRAHLKAFLKRLQRRCRDFAALWRLGLQDRGAPHFHLILYMHSSPGLLDDLRRFVSDS